MINIKIVSSLIGLSRAIEGNEDLLTKDTKLLYVKSLKENININEAIKEIETAKRNLIPDCYICQAKCGKNENYDFNLVINGEATCSNEKINILKLMVEKNKILKEYPDNYLDLMIRAFFYLGYDNLDKIDFELLEKEFNKF